MNKNVFYCISFDLKPSSKILVTHRIQINFRHSTTISRSRFNVDGSVSAKPVLYICWRMTIHVISIVLWFSGCFGTSYVRWVLVLYKQCNALSSHIFQQRLPVLHSRLINSYAFTQKSDSLKSKFVHDRFFDDVI